ncbi:MAG: hypothetical protein JWO67_6448, partial [Streptosporangiaceae bacterium]|nr:hypothetical protein [Streptosporangiaceae bacterium]
MPRPNRSRSSRSEADLARRVAYEREQRGWTYEGTANLLTKAGCAIQPSAIYKIEKGDPPRRISVNELVAFSRIFDIEVNDLLLPVEAVLNPQEWSYSKELQEVSHTLAAAV